jgi:hypothetical protein
MAMFDKISFECECGHKQELTIDVDDANLLANLAAEMSGRMCSDCENAYFEAQAESAIDAWEREQERLYNADANILIYKNHAYNTDPLHCSRMNAMCPKAPTCYGEHIEHDDSTCSNGMVLCTAVDDESDRVMYSIEDLENIGNNNEIPF